MNLLSMALKKYNMNLNAITDLKDLLMILNKIGFQYTRDTKKSDPTFDKFLRMGVIKDEVEGTEVQCDVCSHIFKTPFVYKKVKCPSCGNKTYVEPKDE